MVPCLSTKSNREKKRRKLGTPLSLAIDATLPIWSSVCGVVDKGIDTDPEQGEYGSKKNGPDDNNRWSTILATQQTLEEGIQVDNDPDGKEQLTKERAPRLVPGVDGIRNTGHYTHQVENEDGGRRDEESSPFEDVKLCEISIFVWCFWGDCEVGVDASEYFQQALEDSE